MVQVSGKTWFVSAMGPVTFVHYSTERNIAIGSPQYQWLAQTLRSIDRKVTPWVIVTGHRPGYVDSTSSSDQDYMAYYQYLLDPLFAETKVDLVFYGHTHVTQRHCSSYMGACVMNSTFDPASGANVYDGPQYPVYYSIANAGANSDAGPANTNEGDPSSPGRKFTSWFAPRSAYTRMAVDGDTLTVKYIDARTHSVLDTSVIKKGRATCLQDDAGPVVQNVVLLSVDGMHQGDLDL